jgi:sterol desaturase/sphingolipid hydroxylase (fatty acid hydroxylase superfamily)
VQTAAVLFTFVVFAVVFIPLEPWRSARAQPLLRPALLTDLLFFAGQHLLWGGLAAVVLSTAHRLVGGWLPSPALPGWALVPLALILGDFLVYWFHRACHRFDFLWRFHAVHHSSEHLDWVAAHREHPLDGVLTQLALNLPAMVLGVSFEGLAALALFRGVWAIFIHSNVSLPLGPLLYVFGSPRLHHWHHAKAPGRVANFGNLSPWTDLLFGTFHLPPRGAEFELIPQPTPRSWPGLLLQPLRSLPVSLLLVALCGFTAFAGDAGVDAGAAGGLTTIFGTRDGGLDPAYLPATKSFGAGRVDGLGGLGLRGSASGGGGLGNTLGIGGAQRLGGVRVENAQPVVMGSLSKEHIQRVISAYRGQIRDCYETELAADAGTPSGKIVVKFAIAATGEVSEANEVQSTVGLPRMEGCVRGIVTRMKFPKPAGGGIVIVNYPWTFATVP